MPGPSIIALTDLAFLATGAVDGIAADDAFALWCMGMASDLVREEARQPLWVETGGDGTTTINAPFTARRIALLVAKRTYTNADQEVQSSTGPLSSRVLDEAAAGMRLTDAEIAELQALRDGVAGNPTGLWVLSMTDGLPESPTGFVYDDSGSDWAIPYVDFASTDAMTTPTDTVV